MDHRPVRPNFNVTEEYLIASYRKDASTKPLDSISADLMFLLVAFALSVFGLFSEDFSWCLVGFALLAYRLISSIIITYRYRSDVINLILKYEDAFRPVIEQEKKSD